MTELERAIKNVLDRMAGCSEPKCGACSSNYATLLTLVEVAQRSPTDSVTLEDIERLR